jgi:hypothetical protein
MEGAKLNVVWANKVNVYMFCFLLAAGEKSANLIPLFMFPYSILVHTNKYWLALIERKPAFKRPILKNRARHGGIWL